MLSLLKRNAALQKPANKIDIVRITEKFKNVVCEYLSDTVHCAEVGKRRVLQVFKRSKPLNQIFCSLFSYSVDAERKDKSVKRGMLRFFDCAEQIAYLFVAETFESEEVCRIQIHQIHCVLDVRFIVQKFGGFFTESVDIHCVFRCEMIEFRDDLRRAVIPRAI